MDKKFQPWQQKQYFVISTVEEYDYVNILKAVASGLNGIRNEKKEVHEESTNERTENTHAVYQYSFLKK